MAVAVVRILHSPLAARWQSPLAPPLAQSPTSRSITTFFFACFTCRRGHTRITDDTFCRFSRSDDRDRDGNVWIMGGWIAEVSVAKSRGDIIKSLLKHDKTLLKMTRLRAKIKRHRGDAPPEPGNLSKGTSFPRNEKLIQKCYDQLERLTNELKTLTRVVDYDINKGACGCVGAVLWRWGAVGRGISCGAERCGAVQWG